MTNIYQATDGYFGGRSLAQQTGSKGGARHVFVKLDDIKDDLVFPTGGGQVMNPFPGAAKIYAGDLMEFRTDDNGLKGKVYILKTYEVVAYDASNKKLSVKRSGYHHIPFVGDTLTVAPSTIGGTGEKLEVVGRTATTTSDGTDVWELTLSGAASTAPKKGDVLVESDADGKMLIKNINAVAAWDYDFLWNQAADPNAKTPDFEAARYFLTPSLRGTMYINRMSPMPQCVKDLNISNINGWFRIDALNKK